MLTVHSDGMRVECSFIPHGNFLFLTMDLNIENITLSNRTIIVAVDGRCVSIVDDRLSTEMSAERRSIQIGWIVHALQSNTGQNDANECPRRLGVNWSRDKRRWWTPVRHGYWLAKDTRPAQPVSSGGEVNDPSLIISSKVSSESNSNWSIRID